MSRSSAIPKEMLAARNTGLGSSEIATILGVNPYETAFQLWSRKHGKLPPLEENVFMKAGHMLEKVVAEYFVDMTGREILEHTEQHYTVGHPEIDFLFASPDREYLLPEMPKGRNRAILECKTTQKTISKDDVPMQWFCQLQWQLGITGIQQGTVAWLSRGLIFDFVEYDLIDEFFEDMVAKATEWWTRHMIHGEQPELTTEADIALLYPKSAGRVIEASDAMLEVHNQLAAIKRQIKSLEEREEALAEQVKVAMQDAEKVVYAGETLFSWKSSKASIRVDANKLQEQFPDAYKAVIYEAKPARPFIVKSTELS